MAYESLGVFQNTTNHSMRNTDQKFNLVEFNKIFERNNFYLVNKDNILNFNTKKLNIYYVIVYFLIIIAILLLIYSNLFIKI